jgi:hypothetical protein
MKDEEGVVPAAVKEVFNRVAKSVMKGQITDISRTPVPAYLHHCVSHHGLIKNDLSYCNKWLKQAAKQKDPVERIKCVIANYVSTHVINPTLVQCRIPLNPIIGETYQREMPTGEIFYSEQISHRPPITSYLLEDPDGDYKLYGFCEYKAWLNGPNSIAGSKVGKVTIEFKDGVKLVLHAEPLLLVNNLVTGKQFQEYIQTAVFVDKTNDLEAEINYNPWNDNSYKGMFKKALKWGFGKKKPVEEREKRADDVHIKIYKNAKSGKKEEREEVASGEGSWMSHLMMDGKTYWRVEDQVP